MASRASGSRATGPPASRGSAWACRASTIGCCRRSTASTTRPGRRSAHNQIYWRAEEYLGLGPGACGFLGTVRYSNDRSLERYCAALEAGSLPVASHERLTARQMLGERLILGLRVAEGIPAAWLDERVALERGRLPDVLGAWRERGLLAVDGGRARLTEDGFLLSDALFTELL